MDFLNDLVDKICSLVDIRLIVLFGSTARNQDTCNSDIDLGILVKDLDGIITLKQELAKCYFPKPVDLVILNNADPVLKMEVVRDGKVLFEDEEDLFINFTVKVWKEYCDTQKFRELEKVFIQNFLKGVEPHGTRCTPPKNT